MYINGNDLLIFMAIFIGVCLLIAIGAVLIVALVHIIKTTKKIDKILDDNAENVAKAIRKLPELAEHIDEASISIKANADKVGSVVVAVEDAFSVKSSGDNTDMIMSIVNVVENVAEMLINIFSKKNGSVSEYQ